MIIFTATPELLLEFLVFLGRVKKIWNTILSDNLNVI